MRITSWLAVLAALAFASGCQTDVQKTTADAVAAPPALKAQWLTAAEAKAIDDDASKAQEVDFVIGFVADAENETARTRKLS